MSEHVCLCKKVSEETIKEAIQKGAKTVEAVKETTGATGGCCHGGRCKTQVEALIEKHQ